jgi:predicted O-linked N-acetylglucosamine transferase (SPINDLY family)
VLTLAGRTHVARVGASLLTHTGLTDWIAATLEDYLRIAVAAARDFSRLSRLRLGLRETLRASPLCDAAAFTRGLETAFAAMAKRQI